MKMRKILAIVLCLVMALGLTACKSSAAKATEALIDAIGEVTAESEAAVTAAEEAFKALGEKDRAAVENSAALEEARNTLEIRKTEKLIDAIGEVTAESEAAVTAAESALAALTDAQRSAVSNAGVLTEARAKLDEALEEARIEALKQAVVGTWRYKLNLGPLLCELLTNEASEYNLSMYDYLTDYFVAVDLTMKDDGSYSILGSMDELEEENQRLYDASLGFLRELVMRSAAQECVNQGLAEEAPANWDELGEILGMGEDDFFQLAYSMSKEDYANTFIEMLQINTATSAISAAGKYQLEDGKILLNKGGDALGEDSAVTYTIDGDVMTWSEGTFSLPTDLLSYPLAFERMG